MFPKITLLCLFLLAALNTDAQKAFQQSLGFAFLNVQTQQQSFLYEPFQRAAYEVLTPKRFSQYGTVNYYPRFNVKSWEKSGLSVGIPLAISAFAEFSTAQPIVQEKKNYLIMSLPIVTEWAWGYRSQRDQLESKIGLYFQAGAALTLGTGIVGEFSNFNPYVGGGLRIKVSERIGLELSYGQNFISILELEGEQLFEDNLPPNYTEYGVVYGDQKDRRATQVFHFGLSFQ